MLIGAAFGRFHAGAHPANRGNPSFSPQPRGARLAADLGWDLDPATRPADGRQVCIEVYPHPAMVSLFSLDCVIPYKAKPGRGLPALKGAFERLLDHISAVCGGLLHLQDSPRWVRLRSTAAAAERKAHLRAIEDEVDAIFCAYLAWLWANEPQQVAVFGSVEEGYIVTPNPPKDGSAAAQIKPARR